MPTTSERFEAMRQLSSRGIFCGVQMVPLLPYVNDSEDNYIKRFGSRYSCISPKSKKLWDVFTAECVRLDLLFDMKAITRHYKHGYEKQMLFTLSH